MRLFMKLNATWNVVWPCGPTDKASDYESGDSRFESWQGRFFLHSFFYNACECRISTSYFLQGLIFVVDSNDRERINEAKDELYKMVK